MVLGWLLGLQNARGPMALLIVTNAVNVASPCCSCWASAGRCQGWPRPRCAPSMAASRSACGWRAASCGAWPVLALVERPARRRLSPPARGEPRHHAAQPQPRGGVPRLHRPQLAPGEVVLAANAVLLNFLTFAAFGSTGRPRRRGHGRASSAAATAPASGRRPGQSGPGARACAGPRAGVRRRGRGDRPDDGLAEIRATATPTCRTSSRCR